jgi:hypothetical protein
VLVPTSATIHVGTKGRNGPVVVVFGARYKRRGCVVVAPVVVNSIASAPRAYYVRLVTPKGAVRAQLQ